MNLGLVGEEKGWRGEEGGKRNVEGWQKRNEEGWQKERGTIGGEGRKRDEGAKDKK